MVCVVLEVGAKGEREIERNRDRESQVPVSHSNAWLRNAGIIIMIVSFLGTSSNAARHQFSVWYSQIYLLDIESEE